MPTSKANPATQVCQHTMEALMNANPASGYTKREGDPDKGEQVRHYCTNCWWDVMSHQTTLDVNARQVAEQQAAIIDPAKRAYAAAKRDIETMSFDKNALIQQFEQQVRKGNMSPSQLVWLSPFVFGGLEQQEGHYLLSAMASTIATGSDDPMVRAHNIIYARRRNLEHKIEQVMNSRLPIMPTNGFCPDMDELVLAAALPSPVTGGGETRGVYHLPKRFPDRYGGDVTGGDVLLPVFQHQTGTHLVDATPLEAMIAELRQPILQLIEKVRLLETKNDCINYDALGNAISNRLKATRTKNWHPRTTPPGRGGRGSRGGRGGIFGGGETQQQQAQFEAALFGNSNF